MIDPLALALRKLRGSPNTEAAGHDDAEDADTLRLLLKGLGWTLVPLEPTDPMKAALTGMAFCAGYIDEGYRAMLQAVRHE